MTSSDTVSLVIGSNCTMDDLRQSFENSLDMYYTQFVVPNPHLDPNQHRKSLRQFMDDIVSGSEKLRMLQESLHMIDEELVPFTEDSKQRRVSDLNISEQEAAGQGQGKSTNFGLPAPQITSKSGLKGSEPFLKVPRRHNKNKHSISSYSSGRSTVSDKEPKPHETFCRPSLFLSCPNNPGAGFPIIAFIDTGNSCPAPLLKEEFAVRIGWKQDHTEPEFDITGFGDGNVRCIGKLTAETRFDDRNSSCTGFLRRKFKYWVVSNHSNLGKDCIFNEKAIIRFPEIYDHAAGRVTSHEYCALQSKSDVLE